MNNNKLPHDHGQNEEKVLENLPTVEECKMVADIFKQISDGTRLRILWLLRRRFPKVDRVMDAGIICLEPGRLPVLWPYQNGWRRGIRVL